MRLLDGILCCSTLALATTCVQAAAPDPRPPDKIIVSANGSRLTDVSGGGGSLVYLHYFSPGTIGGIGAEHQFIDDSQWTFGSLRGAVTRGESGSTFSVFGEVNYGKGDDDGRDFDYAVGVLGVAKSFTSAVSMQLETRQIDIDTTQGNLPKLSLAYLWTPRLGTTVSYARSVGGNLGTELYTARLDRYGSAVNFFVGGASGTADPAVVNLQPGLDLPVSDLRQGFIGFSRPFPGGEILLLGDYLELAGSERTTLTLSVTFNIGARR